MDTLFVRLKPFDPRRGHLLRRYTYRGIKFQDERGWYHVPQDVGEYLRTVHQVSGDEHSPLAFDVGTEAEAKALDAKDKESSVHRRLASEAITLSLPREGAATADDTATSTDLPEEPIKGAAQRTGTRKDR